MIRRLTLIALSLLIAIPLFAQTDISGTYTGPVTISRNKSGCPPFSITGNAVLTVAQSGSNVSGNFSSDVSEQTNAAGCPAGGPPISIPYTGTISGNTVMVSTLGGSGTLSISGNTVSGTFTAGSDTVIVSLTKQGAPTGSSGACSLGMSLSCNGGNCSATTTNNGNNACTGDYVVGFVISDEQQRGTVTNFTTTLPMTDKQCFDNGSGIPFGEGLGACIGGASLNPGGSFQMSGSVNFSGAAPSSLVAVTLVLDASGNVIAQAYVVNGGGTPAPTCTPTAKVPAGTQSGNAYDVTWGAVTEPNATYTVEESTSSDFSTITDTRQTNTLSATFNHSVASTTTYYYRVRANSCSGAPGPNSSTVVVVVQAIPTVTGRQGDAVAPLGSTAPVKLNVFIAGQSQPVPFTASVDKPFMSVSPSSGTLPTSGITLVITSQLAGLGVGANTATLTVVIGSSGKGGPVANDTTTITKSVSVSLVTPVGPGTKTLPPPNTLIIPAVAHAPGALGPFQSDVRLTNASGASTQYQITYTPQATDATQSSKSTTITVDSLQTIALNDVLRDFFGVGATDQSGDAGQGVLEIRPLNNPLLLNYASSRTFTFNSRGTFGQFIAAIPFSTFATKAAIVSVPGVPPPTTTGTPTLSLQQVAQSPKFRTNLGIAEGSGNPASGNIKLYSALGQVVATAPYSLRPGEQQQKSLTQWFANLPSVDDGRIEVTVESSTGAVTAYASVLDNNTNDPLEVTPVQVSQISSSRYTLPGMAALNNGASNFHSDVRLYNGGSTGATVTATYFPQGGGTPVAAAPFSIGAGQVKGFDDIVATLFNQTNSGGSILFTTSSASSLVATGRTYTIDPTANNGTYGQFIPGVTPAQGIGTGDKPLQILQLEQSKNFRSNVAVFELSGNPATVHITAYVPDSKQTVATDVNLSGNQFVQLSQILAGMYPGQDVYNARVSVEVTGGSGKVSAYGSVIDNASFDPTYVPAQ